MRNCVTITARFTATDTQHLVVSLVIN
jgi:hypothetical protein